MVAQDDGRSADANVPRLAALEFARHFIEVRKKWLDELEKPFAFRREFKRPPLKQGRSQKFLKLRHLRAYRRLLDAIRDVADGGHDASVARHVIKKFKVMDVH